jgi:hypothetical protein
MVLHFGRASRATKRNKHLVCHVTYVWLGITLLYSKEGANAPIRNGMGMNNRNGFLWDCVGVGKYFPSGRRVTESLLAPRSFSNRKMQTALRKSIVYSPSVFPSRSFSQSHNPNTTLISHPVYHLKYFFADLWALLVLQDGFLLVRCSTCCGCCSRSRWTQACCE